MPPMVRECLVQHEMGRQIRRRTQIALDHRAFQVCHHQLVQKSDLRKERRWA